MGSWPLSLWSDGFARSVFPVLDNPWSFPGCSLGGQPAEKKATPYSVLRTPYRAPRVACVLPRTACSVLRCLVLVSRYPVLRTED